MRTSYRNDPRTITARFAGQCAKCGAPIARGEAAFYYPIGKRLLGMTACNCGSQAARDFAAAVADEDFMNSQF